MDIIDFGQFTQKPISNLESDSDCNTGFPMSVSFFSENAEKPCVDFSVVEWRFD